MPDLDAPAVTGSDMHALGGPGMRVLADVLGECVTAGIATSTDPGRRCGCHLRAAARWCPFDGYEHARTRQSCDQSRRADGLRIARRAVSADHCHTTAVGSE